MQQWQDQWTIATHQLAIALNIETMEDVEGQYAEAGEEDESSSEESNGLDDVAVL